MVLTEIEQIEFEKYVSEYDFSEQLKNKTFLITGSKGIVGSGIIKWILFENKIHNVNAHIIASTRSPENVPDYIEPADDIEFCEFGKERESCTDGKIDYIFHAAAPTSNPASKTAEILADSPYEVYYFYNICGTDDTIAYASASAAAKSLPDVCDKLEDGKNFMWQELRGGHDFNIWYLGFYNFAQIAFDVAQD